MPGLTGSRCLFAAPGARPPRPHCAAELPPYGSAVGDWLAKWADEFFEFVAVREERGAA